jgi:hypothetical protein
MQAARLGISDEFVFRHRVRRDVIVVHAGTDTADEFVRRAGGVEVFRELFL